MKRSLILVIAVALLIGLSLSACAANAPASSGPAVGLFMDLEDMPKDISAGFEKAFRAELAKVGDIKVVETPDEAAVVLIICGLPITVDEAVAGYAMSLTWLLIRGADEQRSIIFSHPAANALITGIDTIDWAAERTKDLLVAYLMQFSE